MTDLLRFATTAAGRDPDFGLGRAGFDAWRGFIVAHALVTRRLDDELRAAHGITLPEYDALVQLAYAEGRTLRMSALAERILLSKSGVTRLVDRLVADGLVARTVCESDARGSFAVLTEPGLDLLRVASETHLRGIREHFLGSVAADELPAVAEALARIALRNATPADDLSGCGGHEALATSPSAGASKALGASRRP